MFKKKLTYIILLIVFSLVLCGDLVIYFAVPEAGGNGPENFSIEAPEDFAGGDFNPVEREKFQKMLWRIAGENPAQKALQVKAPAEKLAKKTLQTTAPAGKLPIQRIRQATPVKILDRKTPRAAT